MYISSSFFNALQQAIVPFLGRSYAPYSDQKSAALLLFADGSWIPGVKVENISFPLTISPLMNALSTAFALGKTDVVGAFSTENFKNWDKSYLEAVLRIEIHQPMPQLLQLGELPLELGEMVNPIQTFSGLTEAAIFEETRKVAHKAYIPHSQFPVGALLQIAENTWIPGCNVEADEWVLGLCAERNALSTAITMGLQGTALYISCPKALNENPTPCGACRQVIAEHFIDKKILIDKGTRPPQIETSASLLPFSFKTQTLQSRE